MVRKYSSRRRSRAPRRTFRRKSRRFTKKRYARNNINQLTMRAPLASRLLRVKLPWVSTWDDPVGMSDSISYAFQGNGIVPYTSLGQTGSNRPDTGDVLPAGQIEYSNLYDRYYINGSSIKIEIINTTIPGGTQQFNIVRAVLLAVPTTGGNDSWQSTKTQLDNYSYDELLSWPYAKWRVIGANTGGSSRVFFKMFRKTKSMCGLKDLRDNIDYAGPLTDGSSSVPTTGNGINPVAGFMYYLRLFNQSSTLVAPVSITARMSLYCTLTNREFNPVITIDNT